MYPRCLYRPAEKGNVHINKRWQGQPRNKSNSTQQPIRSIAKHLRKGITNFKASYSVHLGFYTDSKMTRQYLHLDATNRRFLRLHEFYSCTSRVVQKLALY